MNVENLKDSNEKQDEFFMSTKEDFEEMAEKDEYIGEAYELLKNLSADEKKRLEYEYREKSLKDYNSQMVSAERRGRKEGRKEGLRLGEERLAKLIELLAINGRENEIMKVATDVQYREELLEEFEL